MPFTNAITHPNFLSELEGFKAGLKPAILVYRYVISSLERGEPRETGLYKKLSECGYPSFHNEATNQVIFFNNITLLNYFLEDLSTNFTLREEANAVVIPKTLWTETQLGTALGYPPSAIKAYLELEELDIDEPEDDDTVTEPFGGAEYIDVNAWGNHFITTKEALYASIEELHEVMKPSFTLDMDFYEGVYIQPNTEIEYHLYKKEQD